MMKKIKDSLVLDYSGERMENSPGSVNYELSLQRYKFASKFVKNKFVLDISCGTGYGSYHLARTAKKVIGVDTDEEIIDYCRQKYVRENLEFEVIKPNNNIIKKFIGKFDSIVCIETLEHVEDQEAFLKNLKKYLKPNGSLYLTTPNNFRKVKPLIKFHTYEFDILELFNLLKCVFSDNNINIYGQFKTNILRNMSDKKGLSFRARIFSALFRTIWVVDFKYIHFFRYIEHMNFYKKIGSFQRDYVNNSSIYKINPNKNFINPVSSIFYIEKR